MKKPDKSSLIYFKCLFLFMIIQSILVDFNRKNT